MAMVKETIKLGQVEVRFLLDGDDTGGRVSMFEFLVPPGAKVPAPHFHEAVDEVLYGVEGVLTMTVDGTAHAVGPGGQCYVPRGAVHGFVNAGIVPTRTLAMLTPATIGPAYFRDVAALLAVGGPPDMAQLAEVMRRHGLVVVPR